MSESMSGLGLQRYLDIEHQLEVYQGRTWILGSNDGSEVKR